MGKLSHGTYHEFTPCTFNKGKWNTKEDTGKSMKYVLKKAPTYVMTNSEKIMLVVLAFIKLHLTKRITQSGSYSGRKFH